MKLGLSMYVNIFFSSDRLNELENLKVIRLTKSRNWNFRYSAKF